MASSRHSNPQVASHHLRDDAFNLDVRTPLSFRNDSTQHSLDAKKLMYTVLHAQDPAYTKLVWKKGAP